MYSVNQSLSAKYVEASPYGKSSGNLRVYIPSLMPNIAMGRPKITPVSLNRSCFCNADDCKPSVSATIETQNFVTALKSYANYEFQYYKYGSELKVLARTADCLSCKLAPDEEDNSVANPKE